MSSSSSSRMCARCGGPWCALLLFVLLAGIATLAGLYSYGEDTDFRPAMFSKNGQDTSLQVKPEETSSSLHSNKDKEDRGQVRGHSISSSNEEDDSQQDGKTVVASTSRSDSVDDSEETESSQESSTEESVQEKDENTQESSAEPTTEKEEDTSSVTDGEDTSSVGDGDESNSLVDDHAKTVESTTRSRLEYVPQELVGVVYQESDVRNPDGYSPPYWTCQGDECDAEPMWGNCFPTDQEIDWQEQIRIHNETDTLYYNKLEQLSRYRNDKNDDDDENDVAGLCKPGFLIIGQGKCGTSSLYHYLVSHPKVLPASEKQIHYFKYYRHYPMKWYFQHFPNATSFMASGALMSGEASPGYIPYPDAAAATAERMPGPKIITIGRNPLDRAYSSYRYNYLHSAMTILRAGRHPHALGGQSDDYYERFVFSFEELMRAELENLRDCLAPGGRGERLTKDTWKAAWEDFYEKREQEGLPPPIDVDGKCYGSTYSETVPRKQWKDLVADNPRKIIKVQNLHLVQAMIGRSLYTLPLEWWYHKFPKEDHYFICTEEMSDMSGAGLNRLGSFLGLPPFNFSSAVQAGAYNVGEHRGYDKEITWDQITTDQEQLEEKNTNQGLAADIPLSPELRLEVEDFYRPFNERLFRLTGRRCDWF